MTIKTTSPHITSYLRQYRYGDIYTDMDLIMNSIKTLCITHHDNAHKNKLHRGEITYPWATSHQTTPYYNSCPTCELTRPPPFLLDSFLIRCPIQQTTKCVRLPRLSDLSPFGFVYTPLFERIDRMIEELQLVPRYQTCEIPRHILVHRLRLRHVSQGAVFIFFTAKRLFFFQNLSLQILTWQKTCIAHS